MTSPREWQCSCSHLVTFSMFSLNYNQFKFYQGKHWSRNKLSLKKCWRIPYWKWNTPWGETIHLCTTPSHLLLFSSLLDLLSLVQFSPVLSAAVWFSLIRSCLAENWTGGLWQQVWADIKGSRERRHKRHRERKRKGEISANKIKRCGEREREKSWKTEEHKVYSLTIEEEFDNLVR